MFSELPIDTRNGLIAGQWLVTFEQWEMSQVPFPCNVHKVGKI